MSKRRNNGSSSPSSSIPPKNRDNVTTNTTATTTTSDLLSSSSSSPPYIPSTTKERPQKKTKLNPTTTPQTPIETTNLSIPEIDLTDSPRPKLKLQRRVQKRTESVKSSPFPSSSSFSPSTSILPSDSKLALPMTTSYNLETASNQSKGFKKALISNTYLDPKKTSNTTWKNTRKEPIEMSDIRPFNLVWDTQCQNWKDLPTFSEYLECLSETDISHLSDLELCHQEIENGLARKYNSRLLKPITNYKKDQIPLFLKNVALCDLPTENAVKSRLDQILTFLDTEDQKKLCDVTTKTKIAKNPSNNQWTIANQISSKENYLDEWIIEKNSRCEKMDQFYGLFLPDNLKSWNALCEKTYTQTANSIPLKNITENTVSISYSCALDTILFCLTSCLEFLDLIPPIRNHTLSNIENDSNNNNNNNNKELLEKSTKQKEIDEEGSMESSTPPPSVLRSSFCTDLSVSEFKTLPALLKMSVFEIQSEARKNISESVIWSVSEEITEVMYEMTMAFYSRYTFGCLQSNPQIDDIEIEDHNSRDKNYRKKSFIMFHHFPAKSLSPNESPEVFCKGETVVHSKFDNLPKIHSKQTIYDWIKRGCNYWDGLLNMIRYMYSTLQSGFYTKPPNLKPPINRILLKNRDTLTGDDLSDCKLSKHNLQKMVILSQLRYSFMNFYFGNLRKEQVVHWAAGHHIGNNKEMYFNSCECSIDSVMPRQDPVCYADFDISFISDPNSRKNDTEENVMRKIARSCIDLTFNKSFKLNGIPIASQSHAFNENYEDYTSSYVPEYQRIFGLKHKKHKPLKTSSNPDISKIDESVPTTTSLCIEVEITAQLTFNWKTISLEEAFRWEQTEESKKKKTALSFVNYYGTKEGEKTRSLSFILSKYFLENTIQKYDQLGEVFCLSFSQLHVASYCADLLNHDKIETFTTESGLVKKRRIRKIYQPVSMAVSKKKNHFAAHGLLSKNYGKSENNEVWKTRSNILNPSTNDISVVGEDSDTISFKEENVCQISLMKGWHYDDLINLGNSIQYCDLRASITDKGLYKSSALDPLAECVIRENFVTLGCDEIKKPTVNGYRLALDDPNVCYRVVKHTIRISEDRLPETTYHLTIKNPFLLISSMFYVLRAEIWEDL